MVERSPRFRYRRGDIERRTRDDFERLARRRSGDDFWRSVALIGSVGWPVVLLGVGGALLGRFLDVRWETGVRLTLGLLVVGVLLGSWAAFRSLNEDGP